MEIKQTTKPISMTKRNWKMHDSGKEETWYDRVMNGKIKRPGTASERHLIIV